MMGIVNDIRALKVPPSSELEGYYGDSAWMFRDGFQEAKVDCENAVKKYETLINKLFGALDMHDIHRVDELKRSMTCDNK